STGGACRGSTGRATRSRPVDGAARRARRRRNVYPRVIGPEARRPDDALNLDRSPAGETDAASVCGNGASQELDAVAAREPAQAGSDQQVPALRTTAPAVERRLDEPEAFAPPVQALAE